MSEAVNVTQRRSGRYAIEGHDGRYDGLEVWQTLQCGESCPFYRKIANRRKELESLFGVCTKGIAWKVIWNNRSGRKLRKCQVIRVDRQNK